MKLFTLSFVFSISCQAAFGQLTGAELLDKSIQYHDPNGQWATFSGQLNFTPQERKSVTEQRQVKIDNTSGFFEYQKIMGEVIALQTIHQGECESMLNGSNQISAQDLEKYRLSCERTIKMRDYYTYLYGLPMKLKDQGTLVSDLVVREDFMGKEYLKLKVTYDEGVGSDTWYFYMNPDTFAMEAYQFYHDEQVGDGEYIVLQRLVEYKGIKIPKVRKWYTNKGDEFLGVDDLNTIDELD